MNTHIGLSGWSYKEWKGTFYPPELPPRDWLRHYAQTFHTVEINASFYHLPKPAFVTRWTGIVPKTFRFCPKMSRYLTHIRRLQDPAEPLQRFMDRWDPVKSHVGPVLFQLPPSLQFDPSTTEAFLKTLTTTYPDYECALEARHATWLNPQACQLLKKYQVAWVIAQSGVGFPYAEEITAPHTYIRFHGPAQLYTSPYSEAELQAYAGKIRDWAGKGHRVWVFFNNTAGGHAWRNAVRLKELLA
jgi:uncharacterized protein YecE (DUF72 family)